MLFQSYRGEFATDSQLALHSELRSRRPDLELVWGVKDLSVAVPEGGRALLIESREWYAALGSSRYLCREHRLRKVLQEEALPALPADVPRVPIQIHGGDPVARSGAIRVGR